VSGFFHLARSICASGSKRILFKMPDNDIGDWFRSIPIISRWWFVLSIAFPLAGRIGLLHPMYMFLSWELFEYSFQLWQLFTSLVFSPFSPLIDFITSLTCISCTITQQDLNQDCLMADQPTTYFFLFSTQ